MGPRAATTASLRIGITDYAQERSATSSTSTCPRSGETVEAGAPMGELESTKSVSDLFAPVSGTRRARNEALDASPELCNTDPYGEGWIVEIRPSDPSAARRL